MCSTIGYVVHELDLGDQEAIKFLQERIETDFAQAHTFKLTKPFTVEEYNAH